MYKGNIRNITFWIVWMFPLFSLSQDSPLTLWHHQLNTENGLSSNQILDIFQDSEGFTWIATLNGLNRYDGFFVKKYHASESDSTSLQDDLVTGRFFEDQRKDLWFCTNAAIHCYRRKFDHFDKYFLKSENGLPISDSYQAVALERDSLLWIKAGDNEIFRFNIHNFSSSLPIEKTAYDIHLYPGYDTDGCLKYLFSCDASKDTGLEIISLDRKGQAFHKLKKFNKSSATTLNIYNVLFQHDTLVWLATSNGVYQWNISNDALQLISPPIKKTHKTVLTNSGKLLSTAYGEGLFLIDPRTETQQHFTSKKISDPSFNLDKNIQTPYCDPNGIFWLINKNDGLVYTNFSNNKASSVSKFKSYNQSTNYRFRTLAADDNNTIWCSTFTNGIFKYHGNQITHLHPKNTAVTFPIHQQVNHLIADDNGILWIAGVKGVYKFDTQTNAIQILRDEKENEIKNCTYLHKLKNNKILVSTVKEGVFQINKNKDNHYLKNILSNKVDRDFFTTIYQDSLGSIFIGYQNMSIKVFKYLNDQLKFLTDLPVRGAINGIHEDQDQKHIWIASSNGLVSIDKTNLSSQPIFHYQNTEVPNVKFQSMVADKKNRLWLGSNKGISIFNKEDKTYTNLTIADGIQSKSFHELAILKHPDGNIWLGGNNGITILNPEKIQLLKQTPKIQLVNITINDDSNYKNKKNNKHQPTNVSQIQSLQLPFKENTLSFQFIGIDYSDPKSVQLAYSMEGVDNNWVRLPKGEPGFTRYPNLSPGHYTFKIKATNSDGIWSQQAKTIEITIHPPWYQTWWAKSIFALLTGLLFYAIYKYRVSQIRKELEFKNKEIEYKRLVAKTETAILRLQMNPHFIFNSMNSINSYILQKDIDTASNYLNRFAKLIRMILEFAKRPLLTISEEILLLEQYIQTEAMRFEEKINYDIMVPDNLDPDEIVIPTMILQPFVENAIWHGLAKKKGKKTIQIKFALSKQTLTCSVRDNGVGRTLAQLHDSRIKDHKSLAIDITQQRLKLIEEQEGIKTSLNIIDLFDEQNLPSGTEVIIQIPIL